MKTKAKTIANALFSLALLAGSAAPALAQQAELVPSAPSAVSELPPGAPMPGEQVSPDEVAAKAQYCQYQYQWVCNPYGQCMYQYVWMCF